MKNYLFYLSSLVVFIASIQIISSQEKTCACCSDQHAAFDFWVGEWEVFTADGNVAGYNTITKIQDQCALKENWTSARGGFSGTSYNFYNQLSGQWEQLWIDNAGSQLKLYGNKLDNQMIMESKPFKRGDGDSYVNRITWTANTDGTVRQLWEILKGEEVVQVAFDGIYKKKVTSKKE